MTVAYYLVLEKSGKPCTYSFDPTDFPQGPLYRELSKDPLMFRAFTNQKKANAFLVEILRRQATRCKITKFSTKSELLKALQRHRAKHDCDWVCMDEEFLDVGHNAGTPKRIEEMGRRKQRPFG